MTITFPHKVSIVFEELSIGRSNSDCHDDWLDVYDGNESDSDLIKKICGDHIPSPLESTGNSLTLTFNTDDSFVFRGLNLEI